MRIKNELLPRDKKIEVFDKVFQATSVLEQRAIADLMTRISARCKGMGEASAKEVVVAIGLELRDVLSSTPGETFAGQEWRDILFAGDEE